MTPMDDQIDYERLRSLWKLDDGELLGELEELFRTEAPKRIGAIEAACAAGDAHAIAEAAHRLKGTAANMGAVRLSSLAGAMEHHARAGAVAEAAPLAGEIRAALERAVESVTRFVDEARRS